MHGARSSLFLPRVFVTQSLRCATYACIDTSGNDNRQFQSSLLLIVLSVYCRDRLPISQGSDPGRSSLISPDNHIDRMSQP
ncbi:hypothetical protein QR685DRAFT_513192 [Neurospora intermedia]|uniref:Secreted protein n=1 Tax=Neurospora intermedia TaxID=5142 RepID=A0ABR3DSG4_NEUIN